LWILLVSHANQRDWLSMAKRIAIALPRWRCAPARDACGLRNRAAGSPKPLLTSQLLLNVYQEVRRLGLAALNALGRRGISRADNRRDDRGTGELVGLEISTQAGVTGTSLMPELVAYAGITFDELVRWMVADASTKR
jgi:D-ala D-ala ligase C-terminus